MAWRRRRQGGPVDDQPLKLRAYRSVPIANLAAVLPRTRLVFRPSDAVRLDLITFASVVSALLTARFSSLPARRDIPEIYPRYTRDMPEI